VDPPVTLAESAAEFVGGKDDTELHRNLGKGLIELLMERGGLTLAA